MQMTFPGARVQQHKGMFTFCEMCWRQQDKKREMNFPLKSKTYLTLKIIEMAMPQNIKKKVLFSASKTPTDFLNTMEVVSKIG